MGKVAAKNSQAPKSAKNHNLQSGGGVKKNIAQEVIENSGKSKNGIPKNPKCVWDYEVLAKFYHDILLVEIEDLESAKNGALARTEDLGEDGSNGTDELFSNSKVSGAEGFGKIKEEAMVCEGKIKFFLDMKKQIEAGTFSCKLDYKIFYVKQIL